MPSAIGTPAARAIATASPRRLAATSAGAELCGVADRLGRLAPGYQFDAVLLGSDPADPATFARPASVAAVFQRGALVAREPSRKP